MNPENILKKLPRFTADRLFKDQLEQLLLRETPQKERLSFSSPLRFAFAILTVFIIITGLVWYSQNKKTVLRPSKVLAAEIIRRNLTDFFKTGTIYHQKTKLYGEGKTEPIIYDVWEDMDSPRWLNHVLYPKSVIPSGQELWQGFDLDIRWEADLKEKIFRKDIYSYANPEERNEKKGERVDLPEKYEELLSQGVLEAKEGKLDNRDVYVVYDTRSTPDKSWDILTFDKNTFQLLQTEKYTGEGQDRHIGTLIVYEIQEALPRTEKSLDDLFSKLPVSLENLKIYERHFDTSKGYIEDDYQEISASGSANLKPTPEPVETCKNLCGDGVCQEIVCLAIGCPCAESEKTCPQDCKK